MRRVVVSIVLCVGGLMSTPLHTHGEAVTNKGYHVDIISATRRLPHNWGWYLPYDNNVEIGQALRCWYEVNTYLPEGLEKLCAYV